jgi:Domain of unknown function (DUF3448).
MVKPLWKPSKEEVDRTELTRFSKKIKHIYGLNDAEYLTLHNWSIENPELFWSEIWNDCDICASKNWKKVLSKPQFSTKFSKELSNWFDGARLNFAENLLSKGNPNK